jgi:hypothetical protein
MNAVFACGLPPLFSRSFHALSGFGIQVALSVDTARQTFDADSRLAA